MKPILIVGGGISGLSMAYWLRRLDVPCELIEKSDRFGGLISTVQTKYGLVESAANGFLANADVLEMCQSIGVDLASRKPDRKKRFIFRKYPRRWPLTLKESWNLLCGIFAFLWNKQEFLRIQPQQTIQSWGASHFGEAAVQWLIAPALQGVYAGNVRRMSASLILSRFRKRSKPKRVKFKGTLAPVGGMGELVSKMQNWLEVKGVTLREKVEYSQVEESDYSGVVVATSSFDLKNMGFEIQVESLPLVSVTLFFEPQPGDLKGFGCLFPQKEGFYSLGVLFNSSIFEKRSHKRSETWILGGAFQKKVCEFSDQEILRQIGEDRKRLYRERDVVSPLDFHITRWPQALPHLTVDLEEQLENLKIPSGFYLTGNYLGSIGLSQIISRNKELALQIKREVFE